MKTKKTLLVITCAATLLLNTFCNILFAQAPAIDWQRSYWPYDNPCGELLTQNQSSDDWFFDIANSKDNNGVFEGYLCAGYSSFYATSSCPSDRRAMMMKLDPSGNVIFSEEYRVGEFNGCIQTSDGGYIGIGSASDYTIPYNPVVGQPAQYSGGPANEPHMYIAKVDHSGNLVW
ncbi:MAG TPA: hypothetical protein VFJ43_16615, partial [Bacteroidia bacterium]|nr:hypothetical protein [Bacteroidia bacterium]